MVTRDFHVCICVKISPMSVFSGERARGCGELLSVEHAFFEFILDKVGFGFIHIADGIPIVLYLVEFFHINGHCPLVFFCVICWHMEAATDLK